jgi:hypothetical protein
MANEGMGYPIIVTMGPLIAVDTGQPATKPDGTAPENAISPKFAVTLSEVEPAIRGKNEPVMVLILAPLTPVAGFAVPFPFQLPDGAIRNQIS